MLCALAVGAIAGLNGCTIPLTGASALGSSSPAPASSAPPAAVASAPAATVISLPAAGPPPPLPTSGAAMGSVVPALITYGQWLVANPSAASHVGDVAVAGCPIQQQLTERLASLASLGAHEVTSPMTIALRASTTASGGSPSSTPGTGTPPGTTAVTGSTADSVIVTVTVTRAAETTVSYAGGQVSGSPALDNATANLTLQLGSDKKWRLCEVQPLQITAGSDFDDDDLNIF